MGSVQTVPSTVMTDRQLQLVIWGWMACFGTLMLIGQFR